MGGEGAGSGCPATGGLPLTDGSGCPPVPGSACPPLVSGIVGFGVWLVGAGVAVGEGEASGCPDLVSGTACFGVWLGVGDDVGEAEGCG